MWLYRFDPNQVTWNVAIEFSPPDETPDKTIGWSVGPGSLEFGGQIPLSGRNLPTGPGLGLGYLLTWGQPVKARRRDRTPLLTAASGDPTASS